MHPLAAKVLPKMAEYRRFLHRIPELGNAEYKTHAALMRFLAPLEPNVLRAVNGTGVHCVFRGSGDRSAIAFRADIDALQVAEKTDLPFASEHPGFMHACGHDGHMANLLGMALCLCAMRAEDRLKGDVSLIFQPAEESTGGAQGMIAQGVLDDPHAGEIYGMHLFPDVDLGQVSCCSGAMMASDYEFDVDITGRGAHTAMPQKGKNALDAANALYARLKAVPQMCDPAELALLNVGRMEGGGQRNVVPASAQLQCVVRTYTDGTLAELRENIRLAAEGTARAYDVVVALRDRVYYPPVINPPEMADRLGRQLGGALRQKPLLIAEDFSFYQRQRPGLFFFVGTGEDGRRSPLHSDAFDFDDKALGYALSAFLYILFDRHA